MYLFHVPDGASSAFISRRGEKRIRITDIRDATVFPLQNNRNSHIAFLTF